MSLKTRNTDISLAIQHLIGVTPPGVKRDLLQALARMRTDARSRMLGYNLSGGDRNLTIYPVSFSFPEEKLLYSVPSKRKALGVIIPGQKSTYIFRGNGTYEGNLHLERDYYEDLESSYFAFTFKKAGWDCMRHLEIMSRGCLPLFTDISLAPKGTCALYPKEVFASLLNFPGISYRGMRRGDVFSVTIDWGQFDHLLYAVSVNALLDFTRDMLTTKAMAKYVLQTSRLSPKRMLYLAPREPLSGDYLCDTLLHGFKQLLGQSNVVDVAPRELISKRVEELDERHLVSSQGKLYGKGFTFTKLLFDYPGLVDRGNITEKIKMQFFEAVVIGMAHRPLGPLSHLYDAVCKYYPPEKIIVVYGGDAPVKYSNLESWAKCAAHFFSREIA